MSDLKTASAAKDKLDAVKNHNGSWTCMYCNLAFTGGANRPHGIRWHIHNEHMERHKKVRGEL